MACENVNEAFRKHTNSPACCSPFEGIFDGNNINRKLLLPHKPFFVVLVFLCLALLFLTWNNDFTDFTFQHLSRANYSRCGFVFVINFTWKNLTFDTMLDFPLGWEEKKWKQFKIQFLLFESLQRCPAGHFE